MSDVCIKNGFVERWWIDRENSESEVYVNLQITVSGGSAFLSFKLEELGEIFTLFDINNIESLNNRPCIVLIEDRCMRTIGNFLHGYDEFNTKYYWMYFDEYKDKIESIIGITEEEQINEFIE